MLANLFDVECFQKEMKLTRMEQSLCLFGMDVFQQLKLCKKGMCFWKVYLFLIYLLLRFFQLLAFLFDLKWWKEFLRFQRMERFLCLLQC